MDGHRTDDRRPGAGTADGTTGGSAASRSSSLLVVSAAATVATVLLQIAYPLLDGPGHAVALHAVTVASVVGFAAASLTHAAATHGARTALTVLLVAGGIGLVAEVLGVRTGVPFGAYRYAGTLGPSVLTVPLVVPLAWVMMAWPCLILGRRVVRPGPGRRRRFPAVLLSAWTLAAWDLFLDPQMVAAGHWSFDDPTPGLPGTQGVPLTNLAGWVVVAVVMIAALDRAVPPTADDRFGSGVIAVLLGWTWLGSTLANAVFFDRPAVALWGGVAMGVPVCAYLWRLAAEGEPDHRGRGAESAGAPQ